MPKVDGRRGPRSIQVRSILSEKSKKPADLTMNDAFAYLIGLTLGDGFILHRNNGSYWIGFNSTRRDYIDHIATMLSKRFPERKTCRTSIMSTSKFPNGSVRTARNYRTWINSKDVFLTLRPCKLPDFHWRMPETINTLELKSAFLRGLYDAEGSVAIVKAGRQKGRIVLALYSKHYSNLAPIKSILEKDFGLHPYTSIPKRGDWTMVGLGRRDEIARFKDVIGFSYPPKSEKLEQGLLSLSLP